MGTPSDRTLPGTVAVGFLTDVGRRRERNEDAYYVYLPYPGERNRSFADGVFAVADGMGGHEAGDVASRMAVKVIEESFLDPEAEAASDSQAFASQLERLLQEINRQLSAYASGRGLGRGMGCALTLVTLRGSDLHIAHVGDTRCYRLRAGRLEPLTEDHTWVAQQRRSGLLSEAEAADHPRKNLLTQALGMETALDVYLRHETVEVGDRYLICCDGLHGPVDEATLARVLRDEADPQNAVRRLVQLANDAGGDDNITAIAVYLNPSVVSQPVAGAVTAPQLAVDPQGTTLPPPQRAVDTGSPRGKSRWLFGSGLVVILAAAATGVWLQFGPGLRGGEERAELERVLDRLADGRVLGLLVEGREGEARRLLHARLGFYPEDPAARELLRRLGADSAAVRERLTEEAAQETTTVD